jgi:outer membrane protein assembly factor BamB
MTTKQTKFKSIFFSILSILSTHTIAQSTEILEPEWQIKISDNAFNRSPIIHKDLVIALPNNGDIVLMSLKSGEELWRKHSPVGFWGRSLFASNGIIYFGTKDKSFCSVQSQTGKEIWCIKLPKNIQRQPVEYKGALYIVSAEIGPGLRGDKTKGASIYSINPSDGSINWEAKSNNYAIQTPFALGSDLYVAGSYDDPSIDVDEGGPVSVVALDINNGEKKWQYLSEDGFIKTVYANDTHLAFIGYQDFINGLSTKDGKLAWRRDSGNWVPSISGFEDTIYYGSANTMVHAWNITDGKTIWQYNIQNGSFNYVLGAPIRIEDRIIFMSQKGWLIILNANNGEEILNKQTDVVSRIGIATNGEWVVSGDITGVVSAYNVVGLTP